MARGDVHAEAQRRRGILSAALRLCASLFLFATVATAQDISGYLRQTVSRVEVTFDVGSAVDDGEFRQAIERSVRAGKPLEVEDVHTSIERLVADGLASRVRVSVETANGGVAVTYRITRVVRIAALRFDGVPTATGEEIRARLSEFDTGQRVTQAVLDRGAEEVVRYFQERGYFDVRVTSRLEPDDTGVRATVTYAVDPGEQARVGTFTIVREGQTLPGLEEKLRLKPGAAYTRADLEADLATIRTAYLDAGYLAPELGTPEVVRNPAANAVAINVAVVSGPRVAVEVAGADFSEKELREILPIYSEGGLDEFQLSEGDRRLADQLQRDGYFFARVSHAVETGPGPDARRVVYTIDRGRRFKITDIEIEGTTALTYAEVREQLRTKEAGFIVFARGLTSRSLLERDSDFIEQQLRSIGYRKAQVVERRLGVAPDSDDLVITFVVEEGPRTRVSDVMLRGNKVYARPELLPDPALEPDDFYSEADIATDANAILQHYAAAGYVTAEVTTDIVELDGERVRVVYDVAEGLRARINKIELAGNVQTADSSIETYFRFKEGDVLRLDALRLTEKSLYETGAFRQVLIHSEPVGPSLDGLSEERVVYVDVEETKPWLLVYGGGFNTDDGPRGIVEISNVNLFGKLNTGALRLRASRRQQLGDISYRNPVPFGYNLPALGQVRLEREIKDAFSLIRFTTLLQLQKKIDDEPGRQSGFFFQYNFEQVRLFQLNVNTETLEREDVPVRLGRFTTTYYRDTRNSPFDPDKGQYLSLEGSIAATALGGNNQYLRFLGQYERYQHLPKFDSLVYAAAVKFGIADPYGRSVRLPISERFFSGGAKTLRGFRFEQAGPRDRQTNQPVGGNVLLVINNELRFPLYWRFGGAVFSDTGNVFRNLKNFDLAKVTQTVGAGLRFDTPVGPIRLDVGYLLNPPDGVKRYAVHLNFGQAF
jgi:outer membrane protein insertion porin family